jgi:hypothetical protein
MPASGRADEPSQGLSVPLSKTWRCIGIHGQALWMLLPGVPRTHLRRTTARVDNRLFQFGGVPFGDVTRHLRTLSGLAQHPFGRRAVMGRIGVQANPAVGAGVVTGYRVPQRGHLPTQRANR